MYAIRNSLLTNVLVSNHTSMLQRGGGIISSSLATTHIIVSQFLFGHTTSHMSKGVPDPICEILLNSRLDYFLVY